MWLDGTPLTNTSQPPATNGSGRNSTSPVDVGYTPATGPVACRPPAAWQDPPACPAPAVGIDFARLLFLEEELLDVPEVDWETPSPVGLVRRFLPIHKYITMQICDIISGITISIPVAPAPTTTNLIG